MRTTALVQAAGGSRRHRQRRGFTMMLVIGAMLFMPLAVVSMGALVSHEVRRTRGAVIDVQLRQLLLASVPAAEAELAANDAGPRDVMVPTPVVGATLTLHITPGEKESRANVQVRAEAEYRGLHAAQRLSLTRGADGNWKVTDARLVRTAGQ